MLELGRKENQHPLEVGVLIATGIKLELQGVDKNSESTEAIIPYILISLPRTSGFPWDVGLWVLFVQGANSFAEPLAESVSLALTLHEWHFWEL